MVYPPRRHRPLLARKIPAVIAGALPFTRVHHIGYRVSNLDEAISWHESHFGAAVLSRARNDSRGFDIAYVAAGGLTFELIRPDDASHRPASDERIFDHLAFGVSNIEQALTALRASGFDLPDEHAHPNQSGLLVAGLPPELTGGVRAHLIEDDQPGALDPSRQPGSIV